MRSVDVRMSFISITRRCFPRASSGNSCFRLAFSASSRLNRLALFLFDWTVAVRWTENRVCARLKELLPFCAACSLKFVPLLASACCGKKKSPLFDATNVIVSLFAKRAFRLSLSVGSQALATQTPLSSSSKCARMFPIFQYRKPHHFRYCSLCSSPIVSLFALFTES